MNGKFFLDTNVFVYSFDLHSTAKAKRASELIEEALAVRIGVISFQVVQEFFNVALKKFVKPMTIDEAEQYLSLVFRPLTTINSSQSLYAEALGLFRKYHLSWYDSLIVASAVQGQCEILYSEDLQHGQRIGSLRIENPFLVM